MGNPQEEMRMKELSETQKAYLAGIIDGEGHIGIVCGEEKTRGEGELRATTTLHYHLCLTVSNNDLTLMSLLQNWIEENMYPVKRTFNPNHAQGYKIYIRGGKVKSVVSEVLNYLVVKKYQALIALLFPTDGSVDPYGRNQYYEWMKILNKRGRLSPAETECQDLLETFLESIFKKGSDSPNCINGKYAEVAEMATRLTNVVKL